MTRLICKKTNGIEVAINFKTGEQFITIAGYCRLSGKNNATIRKRCQQIIKKQKAGEIQQSQQITAKNFCWSDAMQSVKLESKNGIRRTLLIPMEWAAKWLKKDRPDLAPELIKIIEEFRKSCEIVNKLF